MRAGAAARKGRDRARVLVITGLSGSGKTHALRALEDAGWFCVDNLPTALLQPFVELIRKARELRHSALGADIRGRDFLQRFPAMWRTLQRQGQLEAHLLFVEARDKVLLRRFSETRRPHPWALNQPLADSIREEREALVPIRKLADATLDTSELNVHQLREHIRERYDLRAQPSALSVTVMSFGFRYGVPPEADLVFDVRFLPNPNFVPELKRLTGNDPRVVRYLRGKRDTTALLRRLCDLLDFVVPRSVREGKSYLTVAVGCTGGRHRSVMVAGALARHLERGEGTVKLRHRDLRLSS